VKFDPAVLGYRLRFLREYVHPLTSGPYSFAELRSELANRGIVVSDSHLRNIFAGRVAAPSWPLILALADIFKVEETVFSDSEDRWKTIESWILTTSAQVEQRRLAAARGLKRREKLTARQSQLFAQPLDENPQGAGEDN